MDENSRGDSNEERKIKIPPEIFWQICKSICVYGNRAQLFEDVTSLQFPSEQVVHMVESTLNMKLYPYASESTYLHFLYFIASIHDNKSFQDLCNNENLNINFLESHSDELFFMCTAMGTVEMIKFLSDRFALLNFEGKYPITALHFAVWQNRPEIVRYLLDSGVSVNDVGIFEPLTPLHFAIIRKNLEIIDVLVSKGANVNAASEYGSSLFVACGDFWFRGLTFLLKTEDLPFICDTKVIEYLLDHGADVNVKKSNGVTPLHSACEEGLLEVVDLLLQRGANLGATDEDGVSTLHYAVEGNNLDVIKLILQKGIDANIRDVFGDTPLFRIRISGSCEDVPKIIDLFLEHGADLNAQDNFGETALHRFFNPKVVEHFLKLKPNINILNEVGQTAFGCCLDDFEETDTHMFMCMELLTAFITRKIVKNEYVCKENLELLKHVEVESTYKECLQEIDRMKDEICHSCHISFYDILKSDCNRLVGFMRNREFSKALDSSGYQEKFPKFSIFLKDSIVEAKRRRDLIDMGSILLKERLKLKLPWTIVDGIFIYLNEKDLKNFVIAFKKTT